MKVAQLLHELDYSLQGTRKTEEGTDHPDRDAQFRFINAAVKKSLAHGWPVISVDTKKKELLGRYHNAGQRWRPAKQPIHVQTHDFPGPAVPRAYPYGIYDIGRNAGFVNVGTDHDTGAFAVASTAEPAVARRSCRLANNQSLFQWCARGWNRASTGLASGVLARGL